MLSHLFPFLYSLVAILLLDQALKVMSTGFEASEVSRKSGMKSEKNITDRTGRVTIHPEILNTDGTITDEDLLTVRFSQDSDPSQSAEASND